MTLQMGWLHGGANWHSTSPPECAPRRACVCAPCSRSPPACSPAPSFSTSFSTNGSVAPTRRALCRTRESYGRSPLVLRPLPSPPNRSMTVPATRVPECAMIVMIRPTCAPSCSCAHGVATCSPADGYRKRTFLWISVVLLAWAARPDLLGVTSFVRASFLEEPCFPAAESISLVCARPRRVDQLTIAFGAPNLVQLVFDHAA